jgi:L-threonylcarbamoyladenylate synthase
MVRLEVDLSSKPAPAALDEAVRAIRAGGIVALPTETFYGLAADPFRAGPIARLFRLKGRPADRPVPLIAADPAQVTAHIGPMAALAARLADEFWPGPLTLLLDAPPAIDPGVTAGTGKVGVRVPAHPVARALCRACAAPLTATSANLSGQPPAVSADDVQRAVGARIDVLIDAGRTEGGHPSTIVDATGRVPRLVRAGAVDWEKVLACANRA